MNSLKLQDSANKRRGTQAIEFAWPFAIAVSREHDTVTFRVRADGLPASKEKYLVADGARVVGRGLSNEEGVVEVEVLPTTNSLQLIFGEYPKVGRYHLQLEAGFC